VNLRHAIRDWQSLSQAAACLTVLGAIRPGCLYGRAQPLLDNDQSRVDFGRRCLSRTASCLRRKIDPVPRILHHVRCRGEPDPEFGTILRWLLHCYYREAASNQDRMSVWTLWEGWASGGESNIVNQAPGVTPQVDRKSEHAHGVHQQMALATLDALGVILLNVFTMRIRIDAWAVHNRCERLRQ